MGIEEGLPLPIPETEVQPGTVLLSTSVRPIIENFLEALHYSTPLNTDNGQLKAAMMDFIESSGVPFKDDRCTRQWFSTALSVGCDMYPSHPVQVQLHIALFTWLAFFIDDMGTYTTGSSNPALGDLSLFQPRFHAGQPQPTPLLECFARNLRETSRYWDPVAANFIVLSALAYVTSGVLEVRPDYRDMAPVSAGANWAYHYRNIGGLPEVYTYFMFPRAQYPEICVFLQAVPDLAKFVNLTNDVLSFYKEEIAGEDNNYIHSRARYENKPLLTTLRDVAVDCADSCLRASTVLAGTGKYEKVWREFIMGYVAMHIKNQRYMLADLGIGAASIH